MEINPASLFNNRNVKWSTVVYFYIVMLCLSEAFIQSCMFIPNYMYHRSQNIECLEYWTARDMTHGCIFKPKNLEFTGRTKNVLDEYLITVNTTDHITMETIEVWVQRKDGICFNNCCHDPVKSKRFLLDDHPCRGVTCHHGGHCSSGKCTCASGYTGQHCERLIDHCSPDPCNGHGICGNSASGYTCTCDVGYSGTKCDKDHPCRGVTCHHGGHCSSGKCICASGYTGQHCARLIDHCSPDPCNGHGICGNSASGYICACDVGYSGTKCDKDHRCHGVTCHHGGHCSSGKCTCASGYTGQHCEKLIDHCSPDPCHNHGKCHNQVHEHYCVCYAGYSGTNCNNHHRCHGVTCHHGGHCSSGKCTCAPGYAGQHCEKLTDHCLPDPCHGHGSCFNSLHGYLCSCNAGYTGTNCNNNVHHCSPDPCNGHGICHYTQIGFTCTCNKGYTGQTCASVIDHCSSNPCHGHGDCYNGVGGHICQCHSGFSGTNCQTVIDHCSYNPCHGHGDCYNGVGGHICQCHSGFSGTNCQTAATKQPIVGTGPILPFKPQPTTKDHVCDNMGLLMDLAAGKTVTMQNANACGGKSSDAVILKHCQAPVFSKWKKGLQVNSHCSQLKHDIPIAEWTGHGFSDIIGILVSCQNDVIEMLSQSCSRNMMVHNVTTPASGLMYTVDWM